MNKVIANTTEGGNPVHIDPVMLHFTKNEKKFGQIWADLDKKIYQRIHN